METGSTPVVWATGPKWATLIEGGLAVDNQQEINKETARALNYLAELILDLSWATPNLQGKEGWASVHRELRENISRLEKLSRGW